MAATTETTAGSATNANPLERLRQAFNRLGEQQKIVFLVALAALIAVVVGGVLWSQQPNWKVLFSNLTEQDGGAIVAVLETQNIPHRFGDNGSLLVPADRVHEVRLKLASSGLPRGGLVGFELLENQKFGTSQFAEQVNYQRGLEGELARTIQSIGAVKSARVHLAIPKPSVFVREAQKPTASVMLTLFPGRTLDPGQIAGIGHLISSSVPQLPMGNVSIIDQNGSLLSQLKSKLTEAGLDPAQLKYVRETEYTIIKRIEDILKPVLGAENFKVQVAADIDFSQSEQTAETFRPNGTPETTSIRSKQTNESANVNQMSGGVPGALTNQPPVPATAPLTQPATGTTAATTGTPKKTDQFPGQVESAGVTSPLNVLGQPISTSKTATTNFEIDKTVRYTKESIGNIRRLSAAMVVNHRPVIGKDGQETAKPLPEAELKQINELVREAMGFNKERGDTISVVNAPFTVAGKGEAEIPIWKDPDNIPYAKELLKYLLIAAAIGFLYFKIIKPSLQTMFEPPEPADKEVRGADGSIIRSGSGSEHAIDGEDDATNVKIDQYSVKLQKARDVATADSKAVANIIMEWMNPNGS